MDNIRLSASQIKLLRSYASHKLVPVEVVSRDYEVLLQREFIEDSDSDGYERHPRANAPIYPRYQISDKGREWLKKHEEWE